MEKIFPTPDEILYLVKSLILWGLMTLLFSYVLQTLSPAYFEQADKYLAEIEKPPENRGDVRVDTAQLLARVEQKDDQRNFVCFFALLFSQAVLWRFSPKEKDPERVTKRKKIRSLLTNKTEPKKLQPKTKPPLPLEEYPESDIGPKDELES